MGVSRFLGSSGAAPAARATAPGWRDPRLWVGIALVAASVLVGAKVLAGADDTVTVWAATHDLAAGDRVTATDLVSRSVHFASASDQALYYGTGETLPAPMRLERGVGVGELLARTAVGSTDRSGLLEVPVSVDPNQVPDDVAAGATVDVYVRSGSPRAGCAAQPGCGGDPVLRQVTVISAPRSADQFGPAGERKLVLGVGESDARVFFRLLARLQDPTLTVVGRG